MSFRSSLNDNMRGGHVTAGSDGQELLFVIQLQVYFCGFQLFQQRKIYSLYLDIHMLWLMSDLSLMTCLSSVTDELSVTNSTTLMY